MALNRKSEIISSVASFILSRARMCALNVTVIDLNVVIYFTQTPGVNFMMVFKGKTGSLILWAP